MKKTSLLGILFILLFSSVSALSPLPEVECCYSLQSGENPDSEMFKEYCSQYNLTEEACGPMIDGWERFVRDFYDDQRGLETCYDEKGNNYPCDEPGFCYDEWGMVVSCESTGIGIVATVFGIVVAGIAAWILIRKFKK